LSTTARVLIGLALGILAGAPSTLAGDDFAAWLDPIPDAVRTAVNVTGDLAVTTVAERHDARLAAPVRGAAPGTVESAT